MTASPIAGELPQLPPVAVDDEPPAGPADEASEEEKRRRRKAFLLFVLIGLLLFLIGLLIWYLLFRQPLPIIPPIPETQVPGYSTSVYGANEPVGVAVSPAGDRIYVTESGGERVVRIFDAAGNTVGTMRPAATTGDNHVPVYLAIDPLTQEVYVSDRPAGTIYIYDRDGRYQREIALAQPLPGWQPLGVAFSKDGTLYVTDLSGAPKVLALDRAGKLVRTVGETEGLSFPNGVAVDAAGYVYVTDSNNGRLLVFDQTGTVVARIGRGVDAGKLGLPRGVAIDGAGRVFVADTTGQVVQVYRGFKAGDRSLESLGSFGTAGIGDGQFAFPNGLAVDGRGRVYVTDSGNDRVQIWSY